MPARTPAQIQAFLDANLHRFDLGVQYLGDEPNSCRKDWAAAAVRWCLLASWPYEQAAGNQSIPAVYRCVNDADGPDGAPAGYLCDRFYLPATPRDLRLLERAAIPVFGIESKHQIGDFDVVGTSISYPVLSMSFVKMLAMSDIPIRWRDREAAGPHNYPMVIVGGQSYGAPEILAPVVDCWWLGEVEDEPGNPGIAAVCARIAAFKASGRWQRERLACYADLAREFRFLYFPRHVEVHYDYEDRTHLGVGPALSKQVVGYTANLDGIRLPFLKRHVKDLDAIAPLVNPPLLYADPAMGSGDLEVGRGCPAWCSFCALTYRQKPYRQRSIPYMLDYAKRFAANMGSVRMAPFSPDFPMHTQRKALIAALLEQVSDEVDAPAMRVDDFIADSQFIVLQVHGGMDAVTLGVEGNSQRMRDLVGKGTADEDIKDAVRRGIAAGIRKFKLFMICGMPGEDEGDVVRILKLAKELADIRESMHQPTVRIQFSWTPLLVESGTPFQWFAPPPPSRILGDIWEEMRDLKIDFKIGAKAEENKVAFFQLCQRASRQVGEALVDAMAEVDIGCWGGVPRHFKDLIEGKLRERGFHNGFADCFDERAKHDLFGWEFIDSGVSSELLWVAYLQMREFLQQTDSHTYDLNFDADYHGNEWIERCDTRCYGKTCGTCDHADLRIRTGYLRAALHERDIDLAALAPVDQRSQAVRIRARLHRPDSHRLVGNDHWRFALRRAAFRARTDPQCLAAGIDGDIAKRSIRFGSDETRARDWTAGTDYVEFGWTRPLRVEQAATLVDAMNTHLRPWTAIGAWTLRPPNAATLRASVDLHHYELEVDADPATVAAQLAAWRATATVPMQLRLDGGYFAPAQQTVNARDYAPYLWAVRDGHRLLVRMLARGATPYAIYAALAGKSSWLEAAGYTAQRLDSYLPVDRAQQDFWRPTCGSCALTIPVNLLDEPFHDSYCPPCADAQAGRQLGPALSR